MSSAAYDFLGHITYHSSFWLLQWMLQKKLAFQQLQLHLEPCLPYTIWKMRSPYIHFCNQQKDPILRFIFSNNAIYYTPNFREMNHCNIWLFYSLTASKEATRTSPGTVDRKAFPGLELTKGSIIVPLATPTMSSIALLIFSVILDRFLTLHNRQYLRDNNNIHLLT